MARLPRIDLADVPQHIIQRGNNRQACFFSTEDYRVYLKSLLLAAQKYDCFIHAYVLMTNHVHLLATGTTLGAVSLMMQSLGRRYVRYVNAAHRRTGTLWEGRFRSSLVDSERYLFACYRYIEMNPVRASIVTTPGDYPWSSFGYNASGVSDSLITAHKCYTALADTHAVRRKVYRNLFERPVDDDEIKAIRAHVKQGRVLGSERFQAQVKAALNRRVELSRPGRPRNVL
ncbi:MAG: transposase [Proteobacteria bacterium]|nr:transposase [Pseudomonadota bacterium]